MESESVSNKSVGYLELIVARAGGCCIPCTACGGQATELVASYASTFLEN